MIQDQEPDRGRAPCMGADAPAPRGAPRRSGAAAPRDVDEELDAALACTFTPSDPLSCMGDPECQPARRRR
jgi:hypothetical protein